MDPNLVYAKTPIGDEAVRQSTRVVQRNLRMVLVQVDGKMSIEELTAKIGNPRLVESALRELEEGGFIAPTLDAVSIWEESKKAAQKDIQQAEVSAMSEFSTFGPKSLGAPDSIKSDSAASNFSSFGKPILPTTAKAGSEISRPNVPAESKPEPEYRADKPGMSSWRKIVLAAAAFLAALVCTVLFYPYEQFKPALEASVTRMLKAPVKIDRVGVTLFPSPRLKLTGVSVGEPADGKIAEVRIASLFSLLGSEPHHISRIDVSGAALAANRLLAMPMFTGEPAVGRGVIIRKMLIERSQVTLGDNLALSELYGEIAFRADGSIEKATFETVDRSLLIDALPSRQGIVLKIEGRAWKPAGTLVSFASLQAKGVLLKDKLLIQDIDTTFLGGILRGNWLLDWSNGLTMAGDGTLSRLDSRKVSAAFAPSLKIEGDMSGTVRLRSSGSDWDGLWNNSEAVLNTEITRGILHGVDLGEAARRSGVSEVRAGATKFDRLRSTISITPKQVIGRDVRMDAGMVTAVGQFVSGRNGQVEGNMAVTLQTSVASQHAPVRIFGTLPDLSATTRK